MAIYHLSAKSIGRNQGRSAVGAAAYRSGEELYNDYDGLTHDFTNRNGVAYKEILLPQNAPKDYFDRQKFWNAVELAEKRKDAQTAREIEIALPLELSQDQQIKLVRDYVNNNFVSLGMGADVAIHDGQHRHRRDIKDEARNDKNITLNNPHAHILLTTREIEPDGLSQKKNRDWNKKENLLDWREQWANAQNRTFEELGLDCRVDHRTLKEQGINREPTIKEGATVREMEKRGIKTERGEKNRQIRQKNESVADEKMVKTSYQKWLDRQQGQTKNNELIEALSGTNNEPVRLNQNNVATEAMLNKINAIRENNSVQPLNEVSAIIPQETIEHLQEKRIDKDGYTPERVVDILNSATNNNNSIVLPTEKPHTQAIAKFNADGKTANVAYFSDYDKKKEVGTGVGTLRTTYDKPLNTVIEQSQLKTGEKGDFRLYSDRHENQPATDKINNHTLVGDNAPTSDLLKSRSLSAEISEPQRDVANPDIIPHNQMQIQQPEPIGRLSPEERRILGQVKDLQSLNNTINGYDKQIGDLNNKLGQAKFSDRSQISDKIRQVNDSKKQATDNLNHLYAIKPEQITKTIAGLQQRAHQLKQDRASQPKPPSQQEEKPIPPQREQRHEQQQERSPTKSR